MRRKKSLSDSFDRKAELFEQQDQEVYNMFNTTTPTDDFFKKLDVKKERTDSNFELKANLDFIDEILDEDPHELSKAKYAIKNYPIPSSGLSSGPGSLVDLERPVFRTTRGQNEPDMLFNENFSLLEMEKYEQRNAQMNKLKPKTLANGLPSHQQGSFTNNVFTQKPFSFNEANQKQGKDYLFNGMPLNRRKEEQRQNLIGREFSYPGQENQGQAYYSQNMYTGVQNNRRQGEVQVRKTDIMKNVPKQQQTERFFMEGLGLNQHLLGITPEQMAMYQGFGMPQLKERNHVNVDDIKRRYTGKLKFFDETKNYGFIIMDDDGSDIFVHFDDLAKAHLGKEFLRNVKVGKTIRLSFCCMQYFGKYNKSRKATDIEFLG